MIRREFCIHKKVLLTIISTVLTAFVSVNTFAVSVVDFYATQSISEDLDMINMTTNLFFTQMQTLNGYTVIDKRDIVYNEEAANSSHISFFAEIHEDNENNWICTLTAIKLDSNKTVSETKSYASYFKILTDAKASLENILTNISSNSIISTNNNSINQNTSVQNSLTTEQNLDSVAGTWAGEDFIEKIILMRSGRGFVIYKNGASMNVLVSIKDKIISVTQTGKSNASFYPNLPREIAQKLAANAEPLSWVLKLSDDNTLTGTKKAFTPDSESESGVKAEISEVTWTKR